MSANNYNKKCNEKLVELYFGLGLSHVEILSFLAVVDKVIISNSTLKRTLKRLRLTRKKIILMYVMLLCLFWMKFKMWDNSMATNGCITSVNFQDKLFLETLCTIWWKFWTQMGYWSEREEDYIVNNMWAMGLITYGILTLW